MKRKKFGRYEIIAELKQGVEGVYRAYDSDFDREVMIVEMLSWMNSVDSKTMRKFVQKAKTITGLEHPSIVPVYDIGEVDDTFYFVTKIMAGGSLADRLIRKPLAINEAAKIISRIALGLNEAHRRGYVHGNLKPVKILFDDANESYVSDFFLGIFESFHERGTVSGTPAYMSPERAIGEELDYRSDIYALGIILFQILSGKVPYNADTAFGTLMMHINEPLPNILYINPDLPPIFLKFMDKAMAKDPQDRFSSVLEMADTLNAIANRTDNTQSD